VEAQKTTPDGVALAQLARGGSDLSKLHRIDFRLVFPSREAAEQAQSQLGELAFATELGEGEPDAWIVVATKRMYPVESDLKGLRDKLEVIARQGHGTYTGWTARVIENP
jgi:hypothetical protein